MSAPTELPRRLPTNEEFAAAERLLEQAHATMERLVWRTREFSRLVEDDRAIPEVLPTTADVGRLYLAAHYLGTRADEFKQMSGELVAALPLLGEMPANAELTREASGDA